MCRDAAVRASPVVSPFGRDDPCSLIELAFRGEAGFTDPDVVITAWLTLLPAGVDPPSAARRLGQRFAAIGWPDRSLHQVRLLSLLWFIAGYRRA